MFFFIRVWSRVVRRRILPGPEGLPFSEAVRVGRTLYLAGQVGLRGGEMVAGGVRAETRQTLNNIAITLQEAGSSMAKVVKTTVKEQ